MNQVAKTAVAGMVAGLVLGIGMMTAADGHDDGTLGWFERGYMCAASAEEDSSRCDKQFQCEQGRSLTFGLEAPPNAGGDEEKVMASHILLSVEFFTTKPATSVMPARWRIDFDRDSHGLVLSIDTTGLASGIYDLQLSFADGSRETIRIQLTSP